MRTVGQSSAIFSSYVFIIFSATKQVLQNR